MNSIVNAIVYKSNACKCVLIVTVVSIVKYEIVIRGIVLLQAKIPDE